MESFFTLSTPISEDDILSCNLVILAKHPAFLGHFPDFPVFPGAFFITIVKEVLETYTNSKLQLKEAIDIKFLALLPMNQNQNLSVKMEAKKESPLKVKVWFEKQGKTYCKMDVEFTLLK